ncbi:kinesin-like protein Klp98A [Ctenocephalides felis]|nr:kinesin-like protein Klp98A [Ctenocephalides felis]
MIIMRILEAQNSKEALDKQIAILHDLQRQKIQLEKYLQDVYTNGDINERVNVDCSTSDGSSDVDTCSNYIEDSNLDTLQNDANSLQYTSVYYMGQGEDCSSPFALSLSRTMPAFNGEGGDRNVISVTGFVIRGARKKTHVEYEIRIYTETESWSLLRRYSKFRDLHLTMKSRYGQKVAELSFPPRHLFSSSCSDETARTRRSELDTYLQRLIEVCSEMPECPLHACRGQQLTKLCLLEFSDFFRKGMFESTRYGTS